MLWRYTCQSYRIFSDSRMFNDRTQTMDPVNLLFMRKRQRNARKTHARTQDKHSWTKRGGENVWSSVERGRIVSKCFCVGDGGRKGGVASSRIFKGENKTVNCNAKVSTLLKKHLVEPVECVQKSISTDRYDSLLMCRRNRVEGSGIQLVPK